MKYKFQVGDKVKLGGDWAQHNQYAPSKKFPVGRTATVVGYPRNYPYDCTRIVFDGNVTPQSFHNTFLEIA